MSMRIRRARISRRDLLAGSIVAGGAVMSGWSAKVLGQDTLFAGELRYTEGQVAGPFYPLKKPLDKDADLTVVKGATGPAEGKIIYLMGRVLNVAGEPIPGANIELWQANARGRYAHDSDSNTAPLDPNFQGYGVQQTDSLGQYRFKTVKPGAYPVPEEYNSQGMRPPHIHFEVSGRIDRLTTQMYFPGEPLNETDDLFQGTESGQASLLPTIMPPTADLEPDSLVLVWDIVLASG